MWGLPFWVWVVLGFLLLVWLAMAYFRKEQALKYYHGSPSINERMRELWDRRYGPSPEPMEPELRRYANDEAGCDEREAGRAPPSPAVPATSARTSPPPPAPHAPSPARGASRGERECRRVLESIFQLPFPNCRPDVLRNPLTGRNLEFDCYCAPLRLACEFQGIQHTNSYGQDETTFLKQVRRDIIKRALADKAGIYLLPVPHSVPLRDIEAYIWERLPRSLDAFVINPPAFAGDRTRGAATAIAAPKGGV